MIGYVYCLYDKDENDIFYVGSSINPRIRLRTHNERRTDYDCMTPEIRFVIKERTTYGAHIMDEIEFTDTDELVRLEIYWIHQLRQWGFNLKNRNYYRKTPMCETQNNTRSAL